MNQKTQDRSSSLVIGCAGFIGSNLYKSLLRNGIPVKGVDLNPDLTHLQLMLEPHEVIRYLQGDIREIDLSNQFFSNVDVIYCCAGNPAHREYEYTEQIRLLHTELAMAVVKLARLHQASKIVWCSSAAVYGAPLKCRNYSFKASDPTDPCNFYGLSHLLAEKYLKFSHLGASEENHEISISVARIFQAYGAGSENCSVIGVLCKAYVKQGGPLPLNADFHKQYRDFIYIQDVCDLLIRLGNKTDHKFNVFNIATGISTHLAKIAAMIDKNTQTIHANEGISAVRGCMRETLNYIGPYSFTSINEGLQKTLEWYANYRNEKPTN